MIDDEKLSGARRKAEDRFASLTRRDAEVMAFQQQRWDAEAKKIERLRALRLARDAEMAAQAAANPAKKRASRTARPKKTTGGKAVE